MQMRFKGLREGFKGDACPLWGLRGMHIPFTSWTTAAAPGTA